MIAVIDYGAGNLQSVCNALTFLECPHVITASPEEIASADGVILPGVGAFGAAMEEINRRSLAGAVKGAALSGKPFLGICLGMQLLFEKSEESPGAAGLGVLPGQVLLFPDRGLKIPHMGWNSLSVRPGTKLFSTLPPEPYVYFVHSYYVKAADESCVAATCGYGIEFHAAVEQGNLFGCQFHPEKSADAGRLILRRFVELTGGVR